MESKITVKNQGQAWAIAKAMINDEIAIDKEATKGAGYNIYRGISADKSGFYICDLGTRLEVNINGKCKNIWIDGGAAYDIKMRILELLNAHRADMLKRKEDDLYRFVITGKINELEYLMSYCDLVMSKEEVI